MTEARARSASQQARQRLLAGLAETRRAMDAAAKELAAAAKYADTARIATAWDHLDQATALLATTPPTRLSMVLARQTGKTLMCAAAVWLTGVIAAGVFHQPPGWMVTAGLAAAGVAAVSAGELMLRLRRAHYHRTLARMAGESPLQPLTAAPHPPLRPALELLRTAETSISATAAGFISDHRSAAAARTGPGFGWLARADPTIRDLSHTHVNLCLAIFAIEQSLAERKG